MSIQSNFNRTLSIAGYLFSQTLGEEMAKNRAAKQNLKTTEDAFNLAAKDYKTKIGEYNEELAKTGSREEPRDIKGKAEEVLRSGTGPAYEAARERVINAAEQVYQLDPTPENLATIQKFAGSEPAKLSKDFEADVAEREKKRQEINEKRRAKTEAKRQKKEEQSKAALAAEQAEKALSEERQRMILSGVYTGPHNVKEV